MSDRQVLVISQCSDTESAAPHGFNLVDQDFTDCDQFAREGEASAQQVGLRIGASVGELGKLERDALNGGEVDGEEILGVRQSDIGLAKPREVLRMNELHVDSHRLTRAVDVRTRCVAVLKGSSPTR